MKMQRFLGAVVIIAGAYSLLGPTTLSAEKSSQGVEKPSNENPEDIALSLVDTAKRCGNHDASRSDVDVYNLECKFGSNKIVTASIAIGKTRMLVGTKVHAFYALLIDELSTESHTYKGFMDTGNIVYNEATEERITDSRVNRFGSLDQCLIVSEVPEGVNVFVDLEVSSGLLDNSPYFKGDLKFAYTDRPQFKILVRDAHNARLITDRENLAGLTKEYSGLMAKVIEAHKSH